MNPPVSPGRPGRRRPLSVEGLEGRELLSGATASHPAGAIPPIGGLVGAPSFQGPATPREYLGPLTPDPGLVNQVFARMAYPATTAVTVNNPDLSTSIVNVTNPQPSQGELARQYLTAEFTGTYTVTPGRFAGQAETIKFVSRALRSNQSLRGKAQVILFPAANAANAAGNVDTTAPFFGTAALVPQNTLYSGETIVLDIEGNPSNNPRPGTASYNAQGLPTHAVWVPDTASGTGYTGATGFNQGYGYMDAVYTPDRNPRPGTSASGKVTVLFQGLFNTAGVLSYNDPITQ